MNRLISDTEAEVRKWRQAIPEIIGKAAETRKELQDLKEKILPALNKVSAHQRHEKMGEEATLANREEIRCQIDAQILPEGEHKA